MCVCLYFAEAEAQLRLRYHADGDIEVVGADEVLPCTRADSSGAIGKRRLKVKANALKRMGVQLELACP